MRSLIIFAVCAIWIEACAEDPFCASGMTYYENVAEASRFVETNEGVTLITLGVRGFTFYSVEDDGSLDLINQVRWHKEGGLPLYAFSGLRLKHAVVPWNKGFRILTERYSLYAEPGSAIGKAVHYVVSSPKIPDPESFYVHLVLPVEETIYVVWSAPESLDDQSLWNVGLGILDDDDRVTPLGEPFYSGPFEDYMFVPGVHVYGGFDPDIRHFWIDHPDDMHVMELDTEGNVIQTTEYVPYEYGSFTNWIKLPDGSWVGQDETHFCFFTLLDRANPECHWLEVNSEYKGWEYSSGLYLGSEENLWITYPTSDGVTYGRIPPPYDAANIQENASLLVGECGLLVTVD